MAFLIRSGAEPSMRMGSANPAPKNTPPMKIHRNGHTWAETSRKIEEAARYASESTKPGKPPTPPVKRS